MDKSDWYKILAIVLVAVFVFEMIAIGVMNNNGPGSGSVGATGEDTSSITTLTGTTTTNMTIVSYQPYLVVSGNGSGIEEAKQRLIDSGVATYEVPATGAYVLNLRGGSDVLNAAAELEKANASVIATVVMNTPAKITVEGEGITIKADGAGFTMQMRPVYEEGSVVPATFTAYVQNGQLTSIGSLSFLQEYVNARIPTALEGNYETAYVEIAWENRSAAKAIAKAANATFKEKSYIYLVNATEAQQNATYAATRAYSTGAEGGILGVRNDFANRTQAMEDIMGSGAKPSFPPSVASFANDTNGSMTQALAAQFAAAGLDATLVKTKVLKLKFPEEFVAGGKTYKGAGYEIEIEQTGPISGNTVWLDAEFEALGNRISRFGTIVVSDDQTSPAEGAAGATITIGQDGKISINGTGAEVISQNGTGAGANGTASGTQNETGAGMPAYNGTGSGALPPAPPAGGNGTGATAHSTNQSGSPPALPPG